MAIANTENKLFFKKKTLKEKILGKTIYQKVFRIYFLIVVLGGIILALPVSTNDNLGLNFFDAFFTAISAFTNTGLSVTTTSTTFNFFGQFIILFLIQTGGIGFLTIVILLWKILRRKRKVTAEQRSFLHLERGSHNQIESLSAIKTGVVVLFIAEAIGAYFLTCFFYSVRPNLPKNKLSESATIVESYGDFTKSLWLGIFHSISSANNAGFDILGSHSIMPYRNGAKNFLSIVLLLESILGGIGYPIFYELKSYITAKRLKQKTQLSLSFKIGILAYFFIAWIGALLAVIFEIQATNKAFGLFSNANSTSTLFQWNQSTVYADKIWNIIYLTFSSRSSGFVPIDISEVTESTRWLLSVLMFIGANPASTGGGIRTITIFIIFSRILYTASGRTHLSLFKKTVPNSIVYEASQVFVLSTMLVVVAVFAIALSGINNKIGDILFEACSAFGTAGLTAGITQSSGYAGKITLIVLMFVGQLGVSNALISITDSQSKPKDHEYEHAELRLM